MGKNNIKLKSYDYLMNVDFDRISKGKRYDMNFNIYDIAYIDKIIEFFKDKEDYEKCDILNKYKSNILNHDINYI